MHRIGRPFLYLTGREGQKMKDRAAETRLFEQAPIVRAILALAIPTVISQIILVIYNMADTFFIGLTGSDARITAVTVCMPAFMFLSAISNLFGVGGASVIARALGAGDERTARNAASFAFWGCAAVTLLYAAAARLGMDAFVNLLGGSAPEVHAEACQYLIWTVVLGGLATAWNALLGHLVRSEGRSLQAGFGIALGGVLNIGLDPLFMFVLLPKGREVMGAAIATSISVSLAAACMAACLLFSRGMIGVFIQHKSDSLVYGARFLRILCLGGPFSACAYGVISFFQAVGESRKSFVLAILRKGVLDIPLMFLLLRRIPVYGIVWATPIADVLCCAAAVALFTAFIRHLSPEAGLGRALPRRA